MKSWRVIERERRVQMTAHTSDATHEQLPRGEGDGLAGERGSVASSHAIPLDVGGTHCELNASRARCRTARQQRAATLTTCAGIGITVVHHSLHGMLTRS